MGKRAKPVHSLLGPRLGPVMNIVVPKIENMSGDEIDTLLTSGSFEIEIGNGDKVTIEPSDVKVEELMNWNSCD